MPRRKPYSLSSYQKARKALLAPKPKCTHCPRRATEADHQPPLILHHHREGTGCCRLVPSCRTCQAHQGGALFRATQIGPAAPEPDPPGFDVDHRVWDVRWLDDLRDIPADGWWPRLMTVPHPSAVDSLGGEFADWCQRECNVRLHWWQRLMATRLLEVDADDRLLWVVASLSVARQSGKSTLIRLLCEWRSEQADRFNEPQTVMHTADTLIHAFEVLRLGFDRARAHGWTVRQAQGSQQIVKPAGEWVVRSQEAVKGSAVSLAVVDEALGVKVGTVTENLMPTLVEKDQSQLVLASTAHSDCTELMPMYRADCIAELAEPERLLILEWSAPRGMPLDDEIAARMASPHWSKRRAQDIAAAARQALALPTHHVVRVGFGCQWFNQWPVAGTRGPGTPLVEPEVWATLEGHLNLPADTTGWVGVEANHYGQGAGVAMAVPDGAGRFELDGVAVETWTDAWSWARKFLDTFPGSRLLLGAALETSVPTDLLRHRRVGVRESRTGLAILRSLIAEGRVVHDATFALDAQAVTARVAPTELGLRLVSSHRCDVLKAASWSLWAAAQAPPSPTIF